MNNNKKRIVFFDGVCGLCNSFIDRLLRWDKNHFFYFSPIQGIAGTEMIEKEVRENLRSIIYLRFGKTFTRSTAVLMIFNDLGGWRRIAVVLFVIPRFIRDYIYDFVANNRYKWFGKKESCRIPSPEERSFFLN